MLGVTHCIVSGHTTIYVLVTKFFLDVGMEETRIGMEGISITHSCIPLYTNTILTHSGGMQEWVIQIRTLHPNSCFCCFSIPTFRIKFLLLVLMYMCNRKAKPHPQSSIS